MSDGTQLKLNLLSPQQQGTYQRFTMTVLEKLTCDGQEAVIKYMRDFGLYNDFALLGAMLKRLFNETRGSMYDGLGAWKQPLELLDCFGKAFRGDEVGHIGNDILTPLLADSAVEMREVAVNVVERWLEYDEDGFWFDLLCTHADREENVPLLARCNKLIELYEEDEEAYEDEEEDEPELPPELEEFYEIRRGLPNNARAIVETGKLPFFLHQLTGVDELIVIDLLESMKIQELTVRDSNLAFFLSNLNVGSEMIMRCWDPDGSFAFSFEPTATEGRWLVFARF